MKHALKVTLRRYDNDHSMYVHDEMHLQTDYSVHRFRLWAKEQGFEIVGIKEMPIFNASEAIARLTKMVLK